MPKKLMLLSIGILLLGILAFWQHQPASLPVVAIANYGPHSSIEASMRGLKQELTEQGFIEGQNIRYNIADVGFDSALIPQMITKLKSQRPQVMVVSTTPVAQYAKRAVKDIPLVFNVITDPVEAGLLKNELQPDGNMTGAADRQDLEALLIFAKRLLPQASRVGMLYSTAEANDQALLKMLKAAAVQQHMQVIAIPVEQARDVPLRMQLFKDKVDFIYVGASGPIQPALPAIAAEARKLGIPLFNVDENAVLNHQVLASFGVDYVQAGRSAGQLVAELLKGKKVQDLPPIFPSRDEHKGFVSKKKAADQQLTLPSNLVNTTFVD